MKARKGVRSIVKTPAEWPWIYHEALITLKPGTYIWFPPLNDCTEVERQAANFRALLALLPKYPLHDTQRWLIGHEKCNYRTEIRNTSLTTWQLFIHATPDYKKDLTNFLKGFK